MDIKELRIKLGDTQEEFSKRYGIPFRTIQNWETGTRKPPQYILDLLEQRVCTDLVNRKTVCIPSYSPKKKNLPKRGDYVGAISWLKAVKECLGEDVVFALDEALMCQGIFNGRNEEYIVWVYGDDSVSEYNGVVVLGNSISPLNVSTKDGLRFTNISRTISDALANEKILDMQGVTEAISRYYYSHDEDLEGITVSPEYQSRYDLLVEDAIGYYDA